jgi:dextranase
MRLPKILLCAAVIAPVLCALSTAAKVPQTHEGSELKIVDVSTDKARYAPSELVKVDVTFESANSLALSQANIVVWLQDRGETVKSFQRSISLHTGSTQRAELTVSPPAVDFHGYRIEVRISTRDGRLLAIGSSAIDVSSNWGRFPRYGYLAHFDADIPAEQWIAELNRFHIDGLQFYDFQYKHHWPLPPPAMAKTEWHDVANRTIVAHTLLEFLQAAKAHNMTTMAYNASYAAYADAFHDGSGVKLQWGAWPDAESPRTEENTKSFNLPAGWATQRLMYMNQNDLQWQGYIFARMQALFDFFPFDGWHIDTYGDASAFGWDKSPINYFAGFPEFANAAHAALHRPVLLNTVSGHGQLGIAHAAVDFVYSELWPEDQPTYASVLQAADEIHAANPAKAIVFPAYLHRNLSDRLRDQPNGHADFDEPAVLLADAVIFASGASHLELGDGSRMLSNPYFPADTAITPSPDLLRKLRPYYDFLVAYENYLEDGAHAASLSVSISGAKQTNSGEAGAVWTIARQKGTDTMVHLINLTGLKKPEWRDDELNDPPAPVAHNVRVKVQLPHSATAVGWASPDFDEGRWHPLRPLRNAASADEYELTIPELRYWTVIFFHQQ